MLLLAMGIVFFFILYQRRVFKHQMEIEEMNRKKQEELIQASIQGEEEERSRIAAELHDDVGATLSSIRLFLHKANNNAALLQESRELLDDSIQKVRNISHKLQPDVLYRLGLQTSLQSYTETLSKAGALRVNYAVYNNLERMPESVELSIYRIVQELVNNIIKHAQATYVNIDNIVVNDMFVLTMAHDGRGMTNDMFEELTYKKGAIGLKNIVNRLKSIDGQIDFSLDADSTYKVRIVLPYAPVV